MYFSITISSSSLTLRGGFFVPQFRTLFGTRGQRRDRFLFRLVFKLLFLAIRLFRLSIPVRFTPDLVEHFFKPCKGSFRGSPYDAPHPPPIHLGNATICEQFQNFISHTIVDWVSAGVLAVWGRVGEVGSPHLVFPLTIEPSKPRLCHDERFLNLWIRDLPFKLDHLLDLPRYVLPGHFQTSFDDRSGYQHVLLHPSARTYFGFQWNDVYIRVLHFSFRMESKRLHLSQFRSRRHKCSSLTWGSCVPIYRRPSCWSVVPFPCRIQCTS